MPHSFTVVPAAWRGNFPHMSPGDRPIWLRYLLEHGDEWKTFAYDVAIGGQEAPHHVTDPALRRAWHFNTAKRIDAVGFRDDAVGLFEIREHAGPGAVGAVVVYRTLYPADHPDVRPLRSYLLTDLIAPDTQRAAEAQGITVLVFPPA